MLQLAAGKTSSLGSATTLCRMLNWCDSDRVDYVLGLARNKKVTAQVKPLLNQAELNYEITGRNQQLFT